MTLSKKQNEKALESGSLGFLVMQSVNGPSVVWGQTLNVSLLHILILRSEWSHRPPQNVTAGRINNP